MTTYQYAGITEAPPRPKVTRPPASPPNTPGTPGARSPAGMPDTATLDRYLTRLRSAPTPATSSEQGPRPDENAPIQSPSLMLLVLLSCAGIVFYASFLFNPANRGDWLPYLLVVVAESVLIVQALLVMWTVMASGHNPRTFAFHHAQDRLYQAAQGAVRERENAGLRRRRMYLAGRPATVDVFITTYGERLDTIRRTVTAARDMQGRHETYVLDDGRSDAVRDLADELGVRYLRRLTNHGAKAGNVNFALSQTSGDFFVIFDADFVPLPGFLHETVPFFVEPSVAFVQTPQIYGNVRNLVSRGAGYMQTVFYRYVQPGRNRFNAAFCVGTNVIFRRAAIDDVGGMYSDSKSEDVWTSLLLHERGWSTVYIPTPLAVGDTPETIETYTKQQLRWATGGFEILLTHNPLSRKRNLTLDQRLQYSVTATHYLTGIAPLLLLLVPPLQIFLDLSPVNLNVSPATWLAYYLGFYGMQIVLAFYTLGSFRWETLMLAAVSFPIYTKALVNVVLRRDQKWHVTGSKSKASSPFDFMIPQVLFFTFLLLVSIVGLWKDLTAGSLSLALAWNATNAAILGAFIVTAFREKRATAHAADLEAAQLAVAAITRQAIARQESNA